MKYPIITFEPRSYDPKKIAIWIHYSKDDYKVNICDIDPAMFKKYKKKIINMVAIAFMRGSQQKNRDISMAIQKLDTIWNNDIIENSL
jgi:hypothetical protein